MEKKEKSEILNFNLEKQLSKLATFPPKTFWQNLNNCCHNLDDIRDFLKIYK